MTLHEILEALDTLSEEEIALVREHLEQRQTPNQEADAERAWFKPGMTYPLLTPYGNEIAVQGLLQALEEAKNTPFPLL
jgi:hypothetical protein